MAFLEVDACEVTTMIFFFDIIIAATICGGNSSISVLLRLRGD